MAMYRMIEAGWPLPMNDNVHPFLRRIEYLEARQEQDEKAIRALISTLQELNEGMIILHKRLLILEDYHKG